jgi:peptidoglycan/LPS O-acetylase OafA/YrhL
LNSFAGLDLMRGIAALMVALGHLRSLMFREFRSEEGIASKLFYFITGFAHEAVIIFFVLSGFFITKSIHGAIQRSSWQFSSYYLNRMSRLWIVLIPSLLVTFLLDKFGMSLVPAAPAYLGTVPNMPDVSGLKDMGMPQLLGNIFFLQHILVPTYGSNSALWSLANEFWYYVLFPFFYFAFFGKSLYGRLPRFLFGFAALVVFGFIGLQISIDFSIWLAGALVFFLHARINGNTRPRWLSAFSLLLFAGTLALKRMGILPFVVNDYTLALVTAIMIYNVANQQTNNKLIALVGSFLARFSYSLYLFHLSFFVFMTSVLVKKPMAFSAYNGMVYLGILLAGLLYGYIMYVLFEAHTDRFKQWIKIHVLGGGKTARI